MGYLLLILQLCFLDFLQSANFGFITTPNGATVTQMGLNNTSIHFVEHFRWKIISSILNKSKGSINLGLNSIDMFVPFELTVYLET